MKVTLKTIADHSGYSISTVSRVLNGSGNISSGVQKKIVKLAEELNYPFTKSKIPFYSEGLIHVAFITNFREGEFYSSQFYGISTAAHEMDIQLSLINVPDEPGQLIKTLNDLDPRRFDGVCLFVPEMINRDYVHMLSDVKNDIPVVSNAMIQSPIIPTVTFDGYSGGHLVAEHFIENGYSSFGIVKGPFEKVESRFRYNGYKDYLEFNGHSVIWEFNGDFTYNAGVKAFQVYDQLKDKPEAIFFSNDLMCKAFMDSARLKHFRIPEDVAVAAFDDLPMCSENQPSITSVKTDFFELGKATLQTVKDIISKNHEGKSTLNLIPVSLSVRNSS